MKIDKIEYKRVINGGHLEYDLLQYLERIGRLLHKT